MQPIWKIEKPSLHFEYPTFHHDFKRDSASLMSTVKALMSARVNYIVSKRVRSLQYLDLYKATSGQLKYK